MKKLLIAALLTACNAELVSEREQAVQVGYLYRVDWCNAHMDLEAALDAGTDGYGGDFALKRLSVEENRGTWVGWTQDTLVQRWQPSAFEDEYYAEVWRIPVHE